MAKNKLFIAVDSDVLRMLAQVEYTLSYDPNFNLREHDDDLIRNWSGYLLNMLKLIKSGDLNIYVGNTIYHEVKHKKDCIDFIKKYCYLPNINVTNFDQIVLKTDDLAFKYCFQTIEKNGTTHYPPMHPVYSPYNKKMIPSTDAYAMAEATLARCLFVTANGKDFVFNARSQSNVNSRTLGIIDINLNEGYGEEDSMGYTVPKPILFKVFGPLIRDGVDNLTVSTSDISAMVKADQLL